MTTKTTTIQSKIDRFFADRELEIFSRRINRGYTLLWDDGHRFARLRQTSRPNEFHILWWDRTSNRWREVGEFGLVLPLNEALEYLVKDPVGLFFRSPTSPQSALSTLMAHTAISHHFLTAQICMLAGACGALAPHFWLGAAGGLMGAGIGLAASALRRSLVGARRRMVPSFLIGAAAGVVGGSTTAALDGGYWTVIGVLAGVASGGLAITSSLFSRIVGFIAGLLVGAAIVAEFEPGFWQITIPAASAWLSSGFLGRIVDAHLEHITPHVVAMLNEDDSSY